MKRARWICMDCRTDTGKSGEHYEVSNEIWQQAHNSDRGMLCILCLEKRLGRKLQPSDFTNSYINKPRTAQRSQRLVQRLGL